MRQLVWVCRTSHDCHLGLLSGRAGSLGAGFMATADLCDPPGKAVVPRRVRVRETPANRTSNNSLFTPMSDSPRRQKLPRLPHRN